MPEAALAAARQAEDSVMKGEKLGPLHGVPFSVKDLIAVKDVIYASGSKTMAKNVAAVNAPSVERAKAAGGILIGKTTTSEFGCKPVGDNLLTGITRNPWNLNKTPGGSSAGAAASVAAGITPFALGTDGRVDPRSVQLFRAVRNQGAFWPRPGLADLGDADPGPCRAHSQGSPRRRAAVQRHCRL
jgi:Asp-tRNA(Asn)/Glu-tRNA(Gln) amidotransferase A subunit family amidase